MKYFAHYDMEKKEGQTLVEHLTSVAHRAFLKVPPVVCFGKDLDNIRIKELCRTISLFHDLGKYTDYFQDWLLKKKKSPYKNHAHLSACLLFLYLTKNLQDFNPRINPKDSIVNFIAYLSVRLHHTNLNLHSLFPSTLCEQENSWKEMQLQIDNMILNISQIERELKELKLSLNSNVMNLERIKENDMFFFMPKYLAGRLSNEMGFFLLIYLFSVLIDSDKLDSAGLKSKEMQTINPTIIDEYILEKHRNDSVVTNDFIFKRTKAKRTMIETINNLSNDDIKNLKIFTLTAPTGIGKTLASLECVLRLRQRIKGYTPRIITAVPFVNIIEQTRIDYENIFKSKATVIVHYSLSDFTKTMVMEPRKQLEERPLDWALLEMESWEGDIILTTFVQLFHSLLTNSNRLLKKINKLAGSIVILDEAQAIPVKYMPLVGALLIKLSEYFGTKFVLMTATEPRLFEFGQKLLSSFDEYPNINKVELLTDNEKYFQELKRTKFVPLLDKKINTKELVSLFLKKWDITKSAVIVVNTIKRSIEIYNKLLEEKGKGNIDSKCDILYLSTNIIPFWRLEIIKCVKDKLITNNPVILVSTQTIEAGVDLDFDIGFRDIAPLESLVQIAGRVNREGKKGQLLPLYIVNIEEDCQHIYKLHNLERTKKLLIESLNKSNCNYIAEPNYRKIIDEYYERELNAGISEESKRIWQEGIKKLDFSIIEEFQLIEKAGEVVDVFVEINDVATYLANAYEEIKSHISFRPKKINLDVIEKALGQKVTRDLSSQLNVYAAKALLKLIKAKMNDYIIQIRLARLKKNRPFEFCKRNGIEANFYWIPKLQISQFYDLTTGFKDETGQSLIF